MAKILFDNVCYEETAPTDTYESVYEAMIKVHAPQLWPRFYPINFKATVYASGEGVKADLVLIERDYTEWWVVEVEMAQHPFESHVLPQVKKLTNAAYGVDEAQKITDSCDKLELARVRQLLNEVSPRVMVVVNKPKPDWGKRLAEFNSILGVFEIFQSDQGKHLFRVNGDHPIGLAQIISACKFDELMSRWLLVEDPISFRINHNEDVSIEFEGQTTVWRRFDSTGKVWLFTPNGPNPLPDRHHYQLVRRGDGRLAFEKKRKAHN